MTKTITKTQAREIIDRLKGIEEIKPGHINYYCYQDDCNYYDDVLLGDVLDKMDKDKKFFDSPDIAKFLILWRNCGLNRSLQDILEGAEEEETFVGEGAAALLDVKPESTRVLKSPVAELFIYLDEVL